MPNLLPAILTHLSELSQMWPVPYRQAYS